MEPENVFNFAQLKKGTGVFLQYIQEKNSEKQLFDDPDAVNLLIGYQKAFTPVHRKISKILLPNAPFSDNASICIFTRDLTSDPKDRNYETTIKKFNELFEASKCQSSKPKIIPVRCLNLEYTTYESKINLSKAYDIYLADKSILHLLPSLLGKAFYSKRRVPLSLNLESSDLNEALQKSLRTVQFVMSGRGSCSMLRVGHSTMSKKQLYTNIVSCLSQLVSVVPGGIHNIKSIHIKTCSSIALPLFINNSCKTNVKLPTVKLSGTNIVVGEVSTVNQKVVITPDEIKTAKNDKEEDNIIKNHLRKRKRTLHPIPRINNQLNKPDKSSRRKNVTHKKSKRGLISSKLARKSTAKNVSSETKKSVVCLEQNNSERKNKRKSDNSQPSLSIKKAKKVGSKSDCTEIQTEFDKRLKGTHEILKRVKQKKLKK